ncbi:Protein SMG8 [Lamellibrachia satsuma]|nr:Protein SMG8 [Lamellibrachia satsuma]
MLNPVTDKDILLVDTLNGNATENNLNYHIDGHYDVDQRVIYLHLLSAYDAGQLTSLCKKASDEISQSGFLAFWHNMEFKHARAVLYLFTISHILLLVHPGSSFDISYVRLFRILESTRQKLQQHVTDLLQGLPISKDWALAGRPCSPRVLFVFTSSTLASNPDCGGGGGAAGNEGTGCGGINGGSKQDIPTTPRNQKVSSMKRLQHAIEDQIYRILRKARVITNISNNSLFAVPANQEFVYIHQKPPDTADPVHFYISQLTSHCTLYRNADQPRSRSYQVNRRANQMYTGGNSEPLTSSASQLNSISVATPTCNSSFQEFLWQHIELAQTKGFDDNLGRNPVPSLFELPTVEQWFIVCKELHAFFMVDQPDSHAWPYFNTLRSLLEIDTRFSESRCAKVLPLAESTYQDGLPQHYTKSYHLNKLFQAKKVFVQHARGPASDKCLRQLEEDCEKLWRCGRQLCEALSLTGNHCLNELHRLPRESAGEGEGEGKPSLPEMTHCSPFKTKATCNCGCTQAERDDPFDLKAANFDVYDALEKSCCGQLEHYKFSAFNYSDTSITTTTTTTNTTTEPKEDIVTSTPTAASKVTMATTAASICGTQSPKTRRDSTSKFELTHSLSLALSLGQSAESNSFGPEVPVSLTDERSHDYTTTEDSQADKNSVSAKRVPSGGSEYLSGMMNANSPQGLVPKFPSWSLLSLGKYSSYSSTSGLDQPGLLHSSNFLLPWDVLVKAEKWPSVSENTTKKTKSRKSQKETNDVMVRMYFGLEYECPRGHRFFCSGPEKILKSTPGSCPVAVSKELTAHKLLTSDMPLYYPCHCRSSKGFVAQLMRVFVVTPEAPISIELNARVQPAPAPCPTFHPDSNGPIPLPPGHIWVLRLPYIYMGEAGPYMMPSDPQQMAACRILKGLFTIKELQPPAQLG